MTPVFYVALGGAVGAAARYGAVQAMMKLHPSAFPLGTMLVNILGALCIGVLVKLLQHEPHKLLLITGVLGGFTTFSAFSLDALQLLQQGAWGQAALYVFGSVAWCLLAVWVGTKLAGA